MTTKTTHGGRRANAGRPRKANARRSVVAGTFTKEEVQRIDSARKPGETRSACIRRLVLAALDR